jgi:MoxR-like ATPase
MQKVVAGQQLIDLVKLVYQANQPLLLYGKHGVGKSELLGNAAKNLGLQLIVRDLSLMEPPDLIGIPQIREGKTFYAAPSFLPTSGKGLLVFEELNRALVIVWAKAIEGRQKRLNLEM